MNFLLILFYFLQCLITVSYFLKSIKWTTKLDKIYCNNTRSCKITNYFVIFKLSALVSYLIHSLVGWSNISFLLFWKFIIIYVFNSFYFFFWSIFLSIKLFFFLIFDCFYLFFKQFFQVIISKFSLFYYLFLTRW